MLNGVLDSYTVSWYLGSELVYRTTTRERSYLLEGLKACVIYIVTVAASTGAELGEATNKTAQYNGKKRLHDNLPSDEIGIKI